uniref:Trafficking protein particle complex subunit n=1 Tax=Caenorhabditis tropicalis TaxID=1561998 RepID=A0A1I7UE12_9PELO
MEEELKLVPPEYRDEVQSKKDGEPEMAQMAHVESRIGGGGVVSSRTVYVTYYTQTESRVVRMHLNHHDAWRQIRDKASEMLPTIQWKVFSGMVAFYDFLVTVLSLNSKTTTVPFQATPYTQNTSLCPMTKYGMPSAPPVTTISITWRCVSRELLTNRMQTVTIVTHPSSDIDSNALNALTLTFAQAAREDRLMQSTQCFELLVRREPISLFGSEKEFDLS